jgi:hypothetical protein
VELQGRREELSARGLGLAAILYEPPDVLRSFADSHEIAFPLLADVGSAVIARYGILNTAETGSRAGIPYPGTFILDKNGRVTARFFEKAYQERFTASSILVRLGGPGPTGRMAQETKTPHLVVRTWASDEVVAPGVRFALVAEVTPNDTIHVYAPGQEGYIPVALTLDEDASYSAHPIVYPESTIFEFKPLNERVKVYDQPFRLVQDVTVALTREMRARAAEEGATLTIKGRLRYQACDDKVCFIPATVPVEWTVRLKKLDAPERRGPQ